MLAAARSPASTRLHDRRRAGGGALAYGRRPFRAVDKIVGPGNLFVALAKRYVYGKVDIDRIAGPSEVVVIADGSTPPYWVAADLISQAEHDALARASCSAGRR